MVAKGQGAAVVVVRCVQGGGVGAGVVGHGGGFGVVVAGGGHGGGA